MRTNISIEENDLHFYYKFSFLIRGIGLFMLIWLGVIGPLSSLEGRGFPEPDELQYSEGILNVSYQKVLKGSDYNVLLLKEQNSNQWTEYYCGYSARHFARANWCFTDEQIEPYKNKHAKIGWYYQDRFLWLKNPHPQLVSLQVDGKEVRSYQDTKDFVKRDNKPSLYIWIVYSIFMCSISIVFYYLGAILGKHCKNRLKERGVVL